MVKSGVVIIVESLLYGCAPWTPLKGHYNKLRITYSRVLLQTLEPTFLTPRVLFECSPPVAFGSRHAHVFERRLTGCERHFKASIGIMKMTTFTVFVVVNPAAGSTSVV